MEEVKTFCRICHGLCGMVATIDNGKVVAVRGDHDNPLTRGYTCIKGLQYPELHHGPTRLRHSLERQADGTHARIGSEEAFDAVAARLGAILLKHGPNAVAILAGTAQAYNVLHIVFHKAFTRSLKTQSVFSTMTIDQSAKWVATERLGGFASGRHNFYDSDVWLLVGSNPLVSLQGGILSGMPIYNPMKSLRDAKARGLKLIVVDPRETETARHADLHLQLVPGEDAALFAGLLHIILREGWHDAAFCARYANGLDALRETVKPFTPAYVSARAGVPEQQLHDAARLFARDSKMGSATSGTGPSMAPFSNLSEHFIESLNVVCGRYAREGTVIRSPGVLGSHKPVFAEAIAPTRGWEKLPRSRIDARYGRVLGELPTGTLADEITTEGEGQVRALICAGSNPGAAVPDQVKIVKALKSLELLVTIDPRYSETARLAHYVIAPTQSFERPDHTRGHEPNMPINFAQYTDKLIDPEPDMDVVDDWYFYWSVAKRLGLPLSVAGRTLDYAVKPTADELLGMLTGRSTIPLDEVKAHPGGAVFDVPDNVVQPPRPEAQQRMELAPPDVQAEAAELFATPAALTSGIDASRYTHRLVVRRMREMMNSFGKDVAGVRKRVTFNPAFMHSDDMAAQGFAEGERVTITSADGAIAAVVRRDDSMRRGVVSMTHSFGALPDEGKAYEEIGSSVGRLIGRNHRIEAINAMPAMSAIPVRIAKSG